MAAEIRDLEDQLYEYDHQYGRLEQELAALQRDNERLRSSSPATRDPARSNYSPSDANQPLEFSPRSASPIPPEPAMTREDVPVQPQSILENKQPPLELPGAPQNRQTPQNRPQSPEAPSVDQLPTPKQDGGGFRFDPEDLLPPTIEQGEPTPPPMAMLSDPRNGSSLSPEDDLELNLSRIELPAQFASNQRELKTDVAATPPMEQVTDRRVVEIAFHPSLSRAANFDDEADDDGLYLVLQPLNQAGQMVPVAADLNVVVLDLAREGDAARIGRWDYSAQDVKGKLRPSGSDQGIHLTLPWNGPDPKADRVLVFVRYNFPDGRQVVADKTFFLTQNDGLKTVWTPKGNGSTSRVAQASHSAPVQQAPPSNVVRPPFGSAATQPAPNPNSLR